MSSATNSGKAHIIDPKHDKFGQRMVESLKQSVLDDEAKRNSMQAGAKRQPSSKAFWAEQRARPDFKEREATAREFLRYTDESR